ncbi:MAG: T9SS type A sorting domain-containing protein [Bacteroidales bacterium]|nr:T9SS type A sorting domain-containing protein [Bacteroidales bacterium]
MKKNLAILIIFITVFSWSVKAQIGVGEWRDHLPFSYSIAVTQSPTKVYTASENGVFSYSKRNQNIEKLTKVNILSDIGVSSIAYSDENEVLLVAYSNGNVDLIFENEVFNLSDIKREMISGSKSINHILFVDEYAYLSCGFGIVVINIEKREVKETYYIGNLGSLVHVNQLVLNNDSLYAATNEGVFIADFTNTNLVDYSNWQLITEIPNYSSKFNSIYVNDDKILVNQVNELFNDIVHSYDGETWTTFINDYNSIREIKNANSSVLIVTNRNILIYNTNFVFQDSISQSDIPNFNPYDVVLNEDNIYWIADKGKGLVKYQGGNIEEIMPNAPYLPDAFSIDIDNNRVLVTAGGLTPAWGNAFLNGAVFSFEAEQWRTMINYDAPDYITIKIDPYNSDHFFAGSWGGGLIEYRNNEIVETYKEHNSTLQTIIPGADFYRIGGIAFDSDNNLWVTNSSVENPISVKKSNVVGMDAWQDFNYDEKISNILVGDIIVTENDHKWVILPSGNGLFAFDNNQTIDNENDDLFKKLSVVDENGKIISNNVYSIAEDLDGDIWVGTDQGIIVYYYPENVFEDSDFHAQRIILTIGDVTQYLLNTEVITSIAIDGANRKWLGTQSSGVYLVSEDGTEEIYHFTEGNSPLLSNRINDIGINHETGEIFFATDKGLISYRGSATMGSDEFRDVYVYPNPVREDYEGDITIRGLVSDVNVKITDISGNIVYETTAEGGQATWNGKNFSGSRVSTGVYLVFCSNEDGSKTHITKLLFIK